MDVASKAAGDLHFEIARTGLVYDCRLTSGAPQNGAVAYASWRSGRASTRCLGGGSPREQRLAMEIAQRLCKRARHAVACTVDLQQAGESAARLDALERAACELAADLGRRLEEQRIRARLDTPGDAATLLAPPPDLERRVDAFLVTPLEELLREHRDAVEAIVRQRFDRRILLFAPLYLSNACLNDCSYCGFRKSSGSRRVKVSLDEAVAEAQRLASQGHRSLDLVTGELPTDAFVDYVAGTCARILAVTPIQRIHLNLGSLSAEQFRRLRGAGATGYHVYQETYDPEVYLDVHPRGPKRDMAGRLEAPRRALEAGFERIGLGILIGLAPVAPDLARLAWHGQLVQREYPGASLGFSLPRIQEAGQDPALLERARVSDETFTKAMLFLRLEFPSAHLTLTTREKPSLRDQLLSLGVTKMSAGVSTAPAGAECLEETRQFEISDHRSLPEVARRIRSAGLVPVYH